MTEPKLSLHREEADFLMASPSHICWRTGHLAQPAHAPHCQLRVRVARNGSSKQLQTLQMPDYKSKAPVESAAHPSNRPHSEASWVTGSTLLCVEGLNKGE